MDRRVVLGSWPAVPDPVHRITGTTVLKVNTYIQR
jgi:hypothetical protein